MRAVVDVVLGLPGAPAPRRCPRCARRTSSGRRRLGRLAALGRRPAHARSPTLLARGDRERARASSRRRPSSGAPARDGDPVGPAERPRRRPRSSGTAAAPARTPAAARAPCSSSTSPATPSTQRSTSCGASIAEVVPALARRRRPSRRAAARVPASVVKVVSITSVPGQVAPLDRRTRRRARIDQWPASGSSSRAKTAGLS